MRGRGEGGPDSRVDGGRGRGGIGATALLVALGLLAASPAAGSVPIGQTIAGAGSCSGAQADNVQISVTSGTPYEVSGDGTITSWTTQQGAVDPGVAWKMKVWRRVPGAANDFQVVGSDGPRVLTPNSLNSFATTVPVQVKAGDLLGLNRAVGSSTCAFGGGTGQFQQRFPSDLLDGTSGTFLASPLNLRLNIAAAIEPSNAFSLGALTRNKSKGTAELTVTVPGPGEVTASGKGVKAAAAAGAEATTSATATAKGEVKLLIKAKGKQKRTLLDTGKVKLKTSIQYTPTGGASAAQPLKVKLKKN